jgi:hypothetical protein
MTARGQQVLMGHLVDAESLGVLSHEGINFDILPSAELRPVVEWALDYYFDSGCERAPSVAAFAEHYGDILDDAEIDLTMEPEDSIEWAIDDLKSSWIYAQSTRFSKNFATEMGEVERHERAAVINRFGSELVSLGLALEPRSSRADIRESGEKILRDYELRAATQGQFQGLGLGLAEVDNHFYGIRDGELAILGAGPKVGKSYFQCWVALNEWNRGRAVAMFTLENSVDMMLNRIACMALKIDAQAWDHGDVTPEEFQRVQEWIAAVSEAPNPLWVLKPDLGQRSFQFMVREAQLRGADSLLIDQLTHVEVGQGLQDRRPRHEKIGEALHYLKAMISTGRHQMPCFLTTQINRDGIQAADKTGRLELRHFAEAAEIERTADFALGLYQSRDEFSLRVAKLQTLGARRTPALDWQIQWRPEVGNVRFNGILQNTN